MGTIGHQPPRKDFVFEDSNPSTLAIELDGMISMAKRHGVALQDVIALRSAIGRESMVRTMRVNYNLLEVCVKEIGNRSAKANLLVDLLIKDVTL
jgi:hypothetical protein